MKLTDIREQLSPEMQELSTKLLSLANAAWQTVRQSTEVTQELAKDPFTELVKQQAAIAVQPQGCIMAGEAPEPHWMRARREKRAHHKTLRREDATESAV